MNRSSAALALAIGLSVLARLLLGVLFTENLQGMDGYYHMRTAAAVAREGDYPLYDPLSWGGRTNHYLPGFHYLLAAVQLSTGAPFEQVCRASGPLLSVLGSLSLFLLLRPRGEARALLAVAAYALVPFAVFKSTVNCLPDALGHALVLHAALLLARGLFPLLCLASFLLAFSHPSSLFLLLFAPFLPRRRALALALCLAPLGIFAASLLPVHGSGLARQNVPQGIQDKVFEAPTRLLLSVGLDPLIALSALVGLALHDGSREERLLMALACGMAALALLGLVEASRAIGYAAPTAAALAAATADRLRRTGAGGAALLAAAAGFASLFLLWSLTYTFWGIMSPAEREALLWLRGQPRGTVATWLGAGQWVATVAGQPNVMDGHFVGREDADERLADLNDLFNVTTPRRAEEVLNRYDVAYLYLHMGHLKWMEAQGYQHDRLVEAAARGQSPCLERAFDNGYAQVYRVVGRKGCFEQAG